MKKLLILAALTVPATAMADVTLYGILKGGMNYKQTKLDGNKDGSTTNVRDYGSRIGFRGNEDLGNGLKAIWQIEQTVSLAGNTSTGWTNRESFVGLQGDFGTLRVGNLRNYFDSDMRMTDAWEYDAGLDWATGLKMYNRHTRRHGSAIRYDSPNFSGFEAAVQYISSDNENEELSGMNEEGKRDSAKYVLGLKYANAGLYAKYGFMLNNEGYIKDGDRKAMQIHRLEAGYNANNLIVSLGYEYGKGVAPFGQKTQLNPPEEVLAEGKAVDSHQVVVTSSYTMGNLTPRITYAHGFKEKNASTGDKMDDSTYNQVIVGGDYALSKRTTGLLNVGWIKFGANEAKTQQTAVNLGIRHMF
ncbi:MAG: porin [Neisseriaceae bacterium]|nr:porin [Neisseriaceae bacterium]